MVKENCGVVGIFSNGDTNVIPMVLDALRALQHRGQEAWGLEIPNRATLKRIGLVSASSNEFKKITEECHTIKLLEPDIKRYIPETVVTATSDLILKMVL